MQIGKVWRKEMAKNLSLPLLSRQQHKWKKKSLRIQMSREFQVPLLASSSTHLNFLPYLILLLATKRKEERKKKKSFLRWIFVNSIIFLCLGLLETNKRMEILYVHVLHMSIIVRWSLLNSFFWWWIFEEKGIIYSC